MYRRRALSGSFVYSNLYISLGFLLSLALSSAPSLLLRLFCFVSSAPSLLLRLFCYISLASSSVLYRSCCFHLPPSSALFLRVLLSFFSRFTFLASSLLRLLSCPSFLILPSHSFSLFLSVSNTPFCFSFSLFLLSFFSSLFSLLRLLFLSVLSLGI